MTCGFGVGMVHDAHFEVHTCTSRVAKMLTMTMLWGMETLFYLVCAILSLVFWTTLWLNISAMRKNSDAIRKALVPDSVSGVPQRSLSDVTRNVDQHLVDLRDNVQVVTAYIDAMTQ